ncbi:type IV toxin-antitoxin system YeeU family antitoxin [Citrobacter portucalensis]|uniref:type IV toxin-antitoxin system YeeU family antitoxin n=1 Tax=Citrobacter freundii complex TaxID=1344959 RepID=UPI00351D254F
MQKAVDKEETIDSHAHQNPTETASITIKESGVSNQYLLVTGEIYPLHAHCVTFYHNGFICEADILGSCS